MIKDKGKWYLTEEGKQTYQKYQDPLEFRRGVGGFTTNGLTISLKMNRNSKEESVEGAGVIEKDASVTSTYEEAEEIALREK